MLDDDSKKKRHGAKSTVDLAEATKRRAEASVALRQKNTTEALRKMRHFDEFDEETAGAGGPASSGKDPMNPFSYDQKSNPDSIPVELLQSFVNLANSTDANEVVHGVLMLRKLLSRKRDPPVDEMISTGVVPRIVDCMTRDDLPALQLEAAWAVSNIAACEGTHTRYVMETRAVEYFIVLLKASTPAIREQAAWGLGNIAGESPELRDVLLHRYQVMPRLLECILELAEQRGTSNVDVKSAAVLQNTTWAVSSCCRQRPLPDLEAVAPAIPVLCYLLQHPSPGVVGDALWALGYICDGGAERVNRVLQSGCLPKVVEFLSNTDCAICLPAARVIGNVASGSESQTDMLLNAGVLSIFEFLIRHPMRLVRREVVWALSNMMAGCERHVQQVLAAELFPRILEQARSHDRAIVKEAAMCILNSSSLGTAQQLEYMVSRGVLATIAELLRAREKRILLAALDSLGNFFAAGNAEMEARGVDENPYVTVFNQTDGVDMLEQLQEVDSQEVASAAADIIVNFYNFEELAGGGGDAGAAAGPIAF